MENRYLADPPVLVDDDGLNESFDEDFEDWLRDHFAFRKQAVNANALLNYQLFKTSPTDSVIVGKDDWLYFADTVPDYTGEGRLTADELDAIGDNLVLLSEALHERGAELYVAVVPNKNTLYPQHMPVRYRMREDEGNIALLRELCKSREISWIDLLTPLREAADGEKLIYYKTDTHWNALGASIAAEIILESMGRKRTSSSEVGESLFQDGDLSRLMGITGGLTEAVPCVAPSLSLPNADYSEHRLSVRGGGTETLLVYRDSFGTAVGPWLAQAFEKNEMRWEYPLDGTRPCDVALLLLCERNIREYLSAAPITGTVADPEEDAAGVDFREFMDAQDDSFFDEEDLEYDSEDDGDDFFTA